MQLSELNNHNIVDSGEECCTYGTENLGTVYWLETDIDTVIYVVEGSRNVNMVSLLAWEDLKLECDKENKPINVELLPDIDCMTTDPINSLTDLKSEFKEETESDVIENIYLSLLNGQQKQAKEQWEKLKDTFSTSPKELYTEMRDFYGIEYAEKTLTLFE